MIFSFFIKILYLQEAHCAKHYGRLIRHTRTSYAGLAMSNKESRKGSERNAGWWSGDVSE